MHNMPEINLASPIETLKKRRFEIVEAALKETGTGFLTAYTQALDEYFRDSFALSKVGPSMRLDKNPYAVVALGGYGRREHCVHSDVDLLLLFEKKIPDQALSLVQEIVYPLWDAGLDVGYATRTIKECIRLGAQDFEVLTSLLDARFVCGASLLYTNLREEFTNKVIGRQGAKYLAWLKETSQGRHERFGDATSLLEPNIKDGQGGLRDYNVMLWMGKVLWSLHEPRDLEYMGHLTHNEYSDLGRAVAFIAKVRNHLHHLAGRRNDQLYFEHQRTIAKALDMESSGSLKGVERFLGELQSHMQAVKLLHSTLFLSLSEKGKAKGRPLTGRTLEPGIELSRDAVCISSPRYIVEDPTILMRLFWHSAKSGVPLSVEARRLVREFAHLVDDDFRRDEKVISAFEFVLKSADGSANVLEQMLNTGFLAALIPEIGGIVHRIQYTQYHVYPVDSHSLETVRHLKEFSAQTGGDSLEAALWAEVSPKKVLLLAGLLHDVGKSLMEPDHALAGAGMAAKALARMGYSPANVELVEFLVENHLLLIKTATRRDLNDEETSLSCARKVGTVNRLKMLYLLTVADSKATGRKAWNNWTALLLRELFFKVSQVMEKGDLASRRTLATVERKKEEALKIAESEADRVLLRVLFPVMSPRYLNGVEAPDMVAHAALYHRLGDKDAVLDVAGSSNPDLRTVTVCAKDRPGLFSKIAGVFTLHNLNVHNARIFTWRNATALDIFSVSRPLDPIFEDEIWQRVEKDLQEALSETLCLEKALENKLASSKAKKVRTAMKSEWVRVDNETSSFFTIVEVFAYDRMGLLYQITHALFGCRLDIWVAQIATNADQIVDVFYVRDFDGQKVDAPDEVAAIMKKLEAVLAGTCPG
ncbi:MAG: [protein-PII] uridylyltransferase [Desulfatibacillaceae bacterium]|nr:[protein-PII] uridylyltransferase [Desulfatibacillaceae bacterium]